MTESVPRLFIFPHAGGSASFYVPFSKAFSAEIKRIAVQYPGRNRAHRPYDCTQHPGARGQASTTILRPGARIRSAPIAFFGHSMGALVAFEVTRRFEVSRHPDQAPCSCPRPPRPIG